MEIFQPIGWFAPTDSKGKTSIEHRSGSIHDAGICLFAQDSEKELPECADRSEVCSKVDLYGAPWVERQCRCPNGRACPSSLHADDGYTIVDKTRRYKLCEPVKRLPICRYFKLVEDHVTSFLLVIALFDSFTFFLAFNFTGSSRIVPFFLCKSRIII